MIRSFTKRLTHALHGIDYARMHDKSFRQQWYGGGIAVTIITAFAFPLSSTEGLFLALAWILILITELQNSAIEAALDRLHPELHDSIKQSKDMAAGAVLLAGLFLVCVVITLIIHRL